MKSIFLWIMVLMMVISPAMAHADAQKLMIVATTFPQYDWTRQILGERMADVQLVLLMDSGVDLHNYQPTVEDMAKLMACDLFIYVGGESDGWVDGALQAIGRENMPAVNLVKALGEGAVPEQIVPGMEHEEDEHEDEDEHEHEHEIDEHVWLSLRHAHVLCGAIAETLGEVDAQNAALYAQNARDYGAKLDALDEEFTQAVTEAPKDALLFADRFAFRYLMDDYGLSYYAAFSGCSAETEASFETIIFLAEKVRELSLDCVMTTEGSDGALARTVSDSAGGGKKIIKINSMQSTTASDVASGASYLNIMRENLTALREALA